MKILVACEYSGIVSAAFSDKSHDVTSADLLPTEGTGKHIQGDVTELLSVPWDMVIAFPPCHRLCIAASWRWKDDAIEIEKAFSFVKLFWNCNAHYICIENPVGWLNNNWRTPDQILSPHFFGSKFQKRTCLWLKNLPPLIYTCINPLPKSLLKQYGSNHNRPKLRSKFSPQLAAAMAQQWNFKTDHIQVSPNNR